LVSRRSYSGIAQSQQRCSGQRGFFRPDAGAEHWRGDASSALSWPVSRPGSSLPARRDSPLRTFLVTAATLLESRFPRFCVLLCVLLHPGIFLFAVELSGVPATAFRSRWTSDVGFPIFSTMKSPGSLPVRAVNHGCSTRNAYSARYPPAAAPGGPRKRPTWRTRTGQRAGRPHGHATARSTVRRLYPQSLFVALQLWRTTARRAVVHKRNRFFCSAQGIVSCRLERGRLP